MNHLFLKKKTLSVLFAAVILFSAASCFAQTGEKRFQHSTGGCPATLLTNEQLFPALLKAIDEAKSEIFISIFSFKAGVHQNSYPDRILRNLSQAVKRGVKVFVILEDTGSPYDDLNIQNKQTGRLLEAKGINVYYDHPKKTTHTKLIVIDEKNVFLGSHNFTQSGLKHNNEISILLENRETARQARDYMLKLIREAK